MEIRLAINQTVACCLFLTLSGLCAWNLVAAENYTTDSVRSYHREKGVVCEYCHTVRSPTKAATSARCSWCHGSPEFIATVTGHLNPNPHNSVHWGPNLECDLCHRAHEPSVNYCSTCHHSEFVVP